MKKYMVLLLACMLALVPFNSGAQERLDILHEEIPMANTEATILEQLGILKGTDKGIELEKNVTRAEALAFIARTVGITFEEGSGQCTFSDIENHWAKDIIEAFYRAGYIQGISETEFAPDRTVTGKEFVKILLSALGAENVTLDNAYDLAKKLEILNDNFTKSTVHNNYSLLRSDAVRLCAGALLGETADGKLLKQKLVEEGVYTQMEIDSALTLSSVVTDRGFADAFNSYLEADGNYMFSPLSIKMALAMVANGSDGESKAEIMRVLGTENLTEYNNEMMALIEQYEASDVLTINTANSIWLNSSTSEEVFAEEFQNIIKAFYKGEAQTVNNEDAVQRINAWVNEKTKGKITGIIDKPEFVAALINAVYFKGSWQVEFDEDVTGPGTFYERGGKEATTDFMSRTGYMPYGEHNGVKIVELKYRRDDNNESNTGTDVGMYILMGEGKVENPVALLNQAELSSTRVSLTMPKFKFEFSKSIKEPLQAMGVQSVFEGTKADLSHMFEGTMTKEYLLTDALHKTYIEVNERETEAAAVTGMFAGMTAMPAEPIEFRADHPFTFVIRDNTNGEVLFMGEYAVVSQ